MEQNNNMLDMENMEIDVNGIEECLSPELPENVEAYMINCVDKPY